MEVPKEDIFNVAFSDPHASFNVLTLWETFYYKELFKKTYMLSALSDFSFGGSEKILHFMK